MIDGLRAVTDMKKADREFTRGSAFLHGWHYLKAAHEAYRRPPGRR